MRSNRHAIFFHELLLLTKPPMHSMQTPRSAALLWSGGKDSALALHEATGQPRYLEHALAWQDALDRDYANAETGTYYLTASGTPEKPIVIKAAGDGEAIFDGNGNFNLFNVKAGNYNYFEGITIRNTDIAIWAGTQLHKTRMTLARSKRLRCGTSR